MIDGLKLRVTSTELRIHCESRSVYHAKRAAEKESNLPELKRSLECIKGNASPNAMSMMNKGYHLDPNDAVEALERDINDHKNKSTVFSFFASHLFDEDYTLKDEDLIRLEITRR